MFGVSRSPRFKLAVQMKHVGFALDCACPRFPLSPLLKEERHAGCGALNAQAAHPAWMQGAGAGAALAADDDPVAEVIGFDRPKQRLHREEADGCWRVH